MKTRGKFFSQLRNPKRSKEDATPAKYINPKVKAKKKRSKGK